MFASATSASPVRGRFEEVIDHSVGRALDQFGLRTDVFPRWDEELRKRVAQPMRGTHRPGDQ